MKIIDQIKIAVTKLVSISTSARLDVELLLAKSLGVSRSYLYSHAEIYLTPEQEAIFTTLMLRRLEGEPIAYILGRREFWSLELRVNKNVLIPRPETEILVEEALTKLPVADVRVLELGTGSGAIAVALAYERPMWTIIATDKNATALEIAKKNAKHLEIDNISFCCGNWYDAVSPQKFAAIISNPPYVASIDPCLTSDDLQYEPRDALCGGEDGLDYLKIIIAKAPEFLLPKGWVMLEHGMDQGAAVAGLLQNAGFSEVYTRNDLAGKPRGTFGRI